MARWSIRCGLMLHAGLPLRPAGSVLDIMLTQVLLLVAQVKELTQCPVPLRITELHVDCMLKPPMLIGKSLSIIII